MKVLVRVFIVVLIGVCAGAAVVFGQGANATHRLFEKRANAGGAKVGLQSAGTTLTAENRWSYYTGYDLEDAKHLIEEEKTRDAIVALTFLWDGLSGQPEAAQVEAVLRMLVRGQGTVRQQLLKLETAQASYETRLAGDRKWYYNLGKNYGQMYAYLCFGDNANFKLKLTELGKMAKTVPVGTPPELVAALVKLGEFGPKQSISESDMAILGTHWQTIDTQMNG